MSLIKYPYTNLHEINLDWLIEKVQQAYSPDNPPDMAVLSVNGMTGDVTLYTDPAVTFPAIQGNSWNIGRTAGGTNVGIKFNKTLPLQRVNGSSLFNIYDEGNPPPYPVASVNGRTGAVQVQEAFFSLTGNTITFITDSPGHFWALDRATVDGSISLKLDTTNNAPSAYLEYLSADESVYRTLKLLTPDDIPSSSGVVSVNGMAGVVSLTAEDIHRSGSDTENVNHALDALEADTQAIHDNIGNVGATSLQSQVNTINTKIGNVGNTPLQSQVDTLRGQIILPNPTEIASLNELKAHIIAIHNSIGNNGVKPSHLDIGAGYSDGYFASGARYMGTYKRSTANQGVVEYASPLNGDIVVVGLYSASTNPTLNIETLLKDKTIKRSAATTHNFSFPNQSSNIIVIDGYDGTRQYAALVYNSTNSLTIFELAKGSNVSVANSGPTLGVTFNQSVGCTARIINISGSANVG